MMKPHALAALTKASVTHLIKQGHMTKDHGAQILQASHSPAMAGKSKLIPKAPEINMMKGPTALKARIPGGGPVDDEGVPPIAEAPMGRLDARMSGPLPSVLGPYDQ